MNDAKKLSLVETMDFIFNSCKYDATGKERPVNEKVLKYANYVGWLEGFILNNCNDEQALAFVNLVNVFSVNPQEDDSDEEEGSFY